MPKYVLGHQLKGEGARLELMSELLDPMHRRHIDALEVVRPGARTLEVGCGNGSISAWLAERVSPRRNSGSCRSGFIANSGSDAES
jgi:tRNA A58 N-methylase Trm61